MKFTNVVAGAALTAHLSYAASAHIKAKNIATQQTYSFFTLNYNKDLQTYGVESLNTEIPTEDSALFCFYLNSEENDCFTVGKLVSPLSYDLFIDHSGEKLSLKYNQGTNDSITPVVRNPAELESAGITKLKKVTKQYQKNKKPQNPYEQTDVIGANVDLAKDTEETKPEPTFLEKNWRLMLIGLVMYYLFANKSGQAQAKEQEKKD